MAFFTTQIVPRLLFFNPEHDLALAANDTHYTPPASATRMANELQRLPLLWADEGDVVLLRDGTLLRHDGASISIHNSQIIIHNSQLSISPWGWDPLVCKQLRQWGVPAQTLPDAAWLSRFREATGRGITARLLPLVHERVGDDRLVGEAWRCDGIEEIRKIISHTKAEILFKQPWSGSGRGLMRVRGELHPKAEAWMQRTFRTQGYVMAEPYYPRCQDLAAEFECHEIGQDNGSRIRYVGLSMFDTTEGGVYAGNVVDMESAKRKRLATMVDIDLYDKVVEALTQLLDEVIPVGYDGPVGVDMMVVEDGKPFDKLKARLHPCVEVNVRHTMGWVALALARRHPDKLPFHFDVMKKTTTF